MNRDRKEPTFGAIDAAPAATRALDANPYRAPSADLRAPPVDRDDAAAVREAHIGHERQLKSVSWLYGIAAAAMLGGALTSLGAEANDRVVMAVLMLVLVPLLGFLAWAFGTLSPLVRWVGTPLSLMGLLAIPVGTLIHAYVLYLVWCKKGRRVLAPDYALIIRAAPQVRYKRGRGDWIALGVVALLIAAIPVVFYLAR